MSHGVEEIPLRWLATAERGETLPKEFTNDDSTETCGGMDSAFQRG